jgi:predicted Zn-dependent protease with MMP-like domain
MNRSAFARIVQDALDNLPEQFRYALENVAILIADEPDAEDLRDMGADGGELFGLYKGVPLTEREFGYSGLPDAIYIYRGPILRSFHAPAEIAEEIRRTVIHELGHHMGLGDDDMPY